MKLKSTAQLPKIVGLIAIPLFLIISCGKKQDPFLIQKHNIGNLTDSTQIKDLKSVFIKDSVADYDGQDEFTRNINNIDIFDKEGKALLTLSPERISDSTAVITSVRILDPRYKTENGISITSTFKDLNKAYTISKIDNLINSIVISVKELNVSFTIDKKELPSNLRFDRNLTIEASQIPDHAKIKYFFVHWN